MGMNNTGTVLIVDDVVAAREIARLYLEEAGYSVLLAADGSECVELFREHAEKINAVVLDYAMPGMTGDETLRELLKIRSDVSVVLSSGYGEEDVQEHLATQPYAGFIQKPYRFATLISKLEELS